MLGWLSNYNFADFWTLLSSMNLAIIPNAIGFFSVCTMFGWPKFANLSHVLLTLSRKFVPKDTQAWGTWCTNTGNLSACCASLTPYRWLFHHLHWANLIIGAFTQTTLQVWALVASIHILLSLMPVHSSHMLLSLHTYFLVVVNFACSCFSVILVRTMLLL